MRRRAQNWLFIACILLSQAGAAKAACVDPMQLVHSTATITRHFDDSDSDTRGVAAIRGTGWFLSPTSIVTAEHVTAAMMLSAEHWKTLEIGGEEGSRSIQARIRRVAGENLEKLTVIELQRPVEHAHAITIRREPLSPEEKVMTITYSAGRPHLVAGRFVRMGEEGKLAGMALLEVYEGENRLIVDHGASGAPVLDCEGHVAAVVSNVFTQSIQFPSRVIRISTAWGMPNVVSVPLYALDDLSLAN